MDVSESKCVYAVVVVSVTLPVVDHREVFRPLDTIYNIGGKGREFRALRLSWNSPECHPTMIHLCRNFAGISDIFCQRQFAQSDGGTQRTSAVTIGKSVSQALGHSETRAAQSLVIASGHGRLSLATPCGC